jgi:arylsulfatase A-like enzyme
MPDLYENAMPVESAGYLTHVLADKAVAYIRQPHTRPFFLSLQFSAPHWPWQAPGDPVNPVGDKEFKKYGSKEKYRHMVQSLDSAIGRVLDAVQEAGIGPNTVIVFTSDNGGERYSGMGGLRQRKFTLWEGGIRVPAMLSWPGVLEGGRVHDSPIIHMDWTATFLALAGAAPRQSLDGINLVPVLQGRQQPEERNFYWRVFQRNQQKALRSGPWKYLKTEKGEYLFHLEEDPNENINMRADHPAVFNRLKKQYAAWEKQMLKPVPLPGQ